MNKSKCFKNCISIIVLISLMTFSVNNSNAGVMVGSATYSRPGSIAIGTGGDASVYELARDEQQRSYTLPLNVAYAPLKFFSLAIGSAFIIGDEASGIADLTPSVRGVLFDRDSQIIGLGGNVAVGLPTGSPKIVGEDNKTDFFASGVTGVRFGPSDLFTLDLQGGMMHLGETWRDKQDAATYGASLGCKDMIYVELTGHTLGEGASILYGSLAYRWFTLSLGTSISKEGPKFVAQGGFSYSFGGQK